MFRFMNKMKGFTLGEVLIAAVIIGLVATITIPSVIANYKNRINIIKLQKAINGLNESFRLMKVEDGVRSIERTDLYACRSDMNSDSPTDGERDCMYNYLIKYFKIASYNKTTNVGDQTFYPYGSIRLLSGDKEQLAEDMIPKAFCFYTVDNVFYHLFGKRPIIDVNGAQEPNQFGRDIFLIVHKDGVFSLAGENGDWNCPDNLNGNGYGCGGRIKDEGWKINY